MPNVPGFLASFADKAQTAINSSPLAGHVPNIGHARPSSPDGASQPSANQAAAQGGKSLALENISYQFRNLQQQYSATTPIQRIITLEKGLSIDFENLSRDSKTQSKELYTWGQSEAEDLKDVTDRLAYLNFVQGSLALSLSAQLDAARAPFKSLRDVEASLLPKRNIRAGMQSTIARLEHEHVKGNDKQIANMREALKKLEAEDEHLEKEAELSKRKALRESESIKWDAFREYAEKLLLLSQAASPIVATLPPIPPSPTSPYTGRDTTAAVRASLQRALDNYKTGNIHLPPYPVPSDLSRSDTQSFGESHASELSSISSEAPAASGSPPSPKAGETGGSVLNTQVLNQSPAPIPSPAPAASAAAAPVIAAAIPSAVLPSATPTIAETGIPVSAGPEGPGPASGSLKAADPAPAPTPAVPAVGATPKHETAEEEKKRLAALYSPPVATPAPASTSYAPPTSAPPAVSPSVDQTPRVESAEEEKKRLEREERERLLRGKGPDVPSKDEEPEEELPPYQEPGM